MMHLEAASPEGLDKALVAALEEKGTNRQAALSVYGPNILVCQFSLPRLSSRELRNSLSLEAVGLLSLSPDQIELDYQVLRASADKINGVFMALPKTTLREYLACFEKKNITCARITAAILARINSFLYQNNIKDASFCLIDFYTQNLINLSIFNKGQCEFLRQISYENIEDAQEEIVRSFKYAWGKSDLKRLEGVYSLGEPSDKKTLITNLEIELGVTINHSEYQDASLNGRVRGNFFKLDLGKRCSIAVSERRDILRWINWVIAAFMVLCAILGLQVTQQRGYIKELSAKFKTADYQRALNLRKQIQSLNNAK